MRILSFSFLVELRRPLKLYLSFLRMLRYFTLLWWSLCAKSCWFCSWIRKMLFISILFLLQLYVMIRLSLIMLYFILTMYLHFFTTFLFHLSVYQISLVFKLTKCYLFKLRVEFVGHNLTTYGNCLAESKFVLIQYWLFSPHVQWFLSLIGRYGFHSWFSRGLRQISNHFVNYNVIFIENPLPLFLGHVL